MTYKTIVFTIIITFLQISQKLNAQQKWSLNECIVYAKTNNFELKEYEIQEKISVENYKQSKRNLLPGVSASTNAGLSFGRSIDPITNDYITNSFFNNSYNIGTSVTLFNGFQLKNQIQFQKFRKQASENNRLSAIDDLAFKVMTSYFDVLYFKGLLEIASEQIEASKLNLKTTEKKVEVGLQARADLLEMRANIEKEELNRIQIENSKETALLQLMQHMNYINDDLELAEPSETTIQNLQPETQNLFGQYISWSPYYKSFEYGLKVSEKNLAISKGNLYPYINAHGSLNTAFSETNKNTFGEIINFNEQFKNNQNQYFGASLNIPIFSRWNNRSMITKAKLEVEQAKNRLEIEQQNLYFIVANDVNELEALNKEYNQFKKQNEADQLAFKAAEKKFEQGLINVVEYYIAKNRMANTESELLRARYQWEMKRKTLEFYKGKRFWENESKESRQSQLQ